jgi:superfamily II DNA or RNA helicase
MGQKGYTIYKKNLEVEEQEELREELTAKPFVAKNSMSKQVKFPIYRESKQKFYVPRFYGIQKYGVPKEIKLSDGEDINIEFNGSLREHQKPVVEDFVNHVKKNSCGLLELFCGYGKTVLALNIISKLKKKTLVIVHKEFLLNQWVERIEQFLPMARIGRIQGSIVDTDDKDIVIGMLQSISMKTYPISLFQEFGFTIIDETHHISAEVFSNSLFKIVTKYMLGLSATMNRKDGLTKVFKMFLGDVVVKKQREDDTPVTVKAIEYHTEDEYFNETIYNFKGQTHYSLMISKLCEFNPRREFVLRVLVDTLKQAKKDKERMQVMILAHNKNLLHYLYEAIEYRKIASVGYYIGGMKQKDLKKSEDKQVIIATYAMAEEALDIKTLTTLIMATPKTDVTQAVGRILRSTDHKPLVIDIVDIHETFKRQWLKRKRFYNSNKYKIMYSEDYDTNEWVISQSTRGKKAISNEKQTKITDIKLKSKLKTTKQQDLLTGASVLDAFI